MSVMILAKIHVNNRGKQHVVDQKKIRVLLLFNPQGREAQG